MKKLSELLETLEYRLERADGSPLSGSAAKEALGAGIIDITNDSRSAAEGTLFFCIAGANRNGHDFAAEVTERGARALVIGRDVELASVSEEKKRDLILVRVPDTRYAMAFISAAWFGHPAERLRVIGVTGTKGKTTTTYLIKSILEKAGRRVGLIGTIETVIGDRHIPAANTTPESLVLQRTFAEMAEAGMEIVVMEVSSQALMLHRTQGFRFDIGVFTNLEPDHIGPNEHRDFHEYMHCKSLLFRQCRIGIVNGDDGHLPGILEGHLCEVETFGLGEGNDLRAKDLRLLHRPGELGIAFSTEGLLALSAEVPTPGRFSVYNALCAIAVARRFGVSAEEIRAALPGVRVRGRIEMIPVSDTFTLMIDYAHNAMALESLLTTLRAYQPHRLVCLFGCGGNRSRQRRYEMGEVSGRLSDLTVITSDNPRNEEPMAIIADIRTGIGRTDGAFVEIPDRREAIRYVIEHGEPGDIIVLAGKGHEDYQEIRGVKYPMDEREIIAEILKEKPEE
ncbi:UDP-N-acetylmuramoyl-L-alanyl-D-glutamate--2,6-diaminopimelate ligase [Lachnoclostridium sp. Marseille-P6806]|uniref:UDP-N-acetylmuramoyl-L-alanyl-D-glutamate--2, 6-diaminopimelate ligase n=1 Tax=Lachnoclostridium sp. Marseille-P6806 TaxID=2364793 RepID=UPI001031794F|nr:UDP-N-acetylmuramoyl-L-alanyl-D-glutamate--2,6-diaminopimelate ligase [Lachnoclostridium sp. Marseille-P6806]